jgi:2-keto-3-deoxy-6-phosphogluconate aldolase
VAASGVQATQEGLAAWFKAGVAGVGIGGDLIRKGYLESGKVEARAARITEILALTREVRSKSYSCPLPR